MKLNKTDMLQKTETKANAKMKVKEREEKERDEREREARIFVQIWKHKGGRCISKCFSIGNYGSEHFLQSYCHSSKSRRAVEMSVWLEEKGVAAISDIARDHTRSFLG